MGAVVLKRARHSYRRKDVHLGAQRPALAVVPRRHVLPPILCRIGLVDHEGRQPGRIVCQHHRHAQGPAEAQVSCAILQPFRRRIGCPQVEQRQRAHALQLGQVRRILGEFQAHRLAYRPRRRCQPDASVRRAELSSLRGKRARCHHLSHQQRRCRHRRHPRRGFDRVRLLSVARARPRPERRQRSGAEPRPVLHHRHRHPFRHAHLERHAHPASQVQPPDVPAHLAALGIVLRPRRLHHLQLLWHAVHQHAVPQHQTAAVRHHQRVGHHIAGQRQPRHHPLLQHYPRLWPACSVARDQRQVEGAGQGKGGVRD